MHIFLIYIYSILGMFLSIIQMIFVYYLVEESLFVTRRYKDPNSSDVEELAIYMVSSLFVISIILLFEFITRLVITGNIRVASMTSAISFCIYATYVWVKYRISI